MENEEQSSWTEVNDEPHGPHRMQGTFGRCENCGPRHLHGNAWRLVPGTARYCIRLRTRCRGKRHQAESNRPLPVRSRKSVGRPDEPRASMSESRLIRCRSCGVIAYRSAAERRDQDVASTRWVCGRCQDASARRRQAGDRHGRGRSASEVECIAAAGGRSTCGRRGAGPCRMLAPVIDGAGVGDGGASVRFAEAQRRTRIPPRRPASTLRSTPAPSWCSRAAARSTASAGVQPRSETERRLGSAAG